MQYMDHIDCRFKWSRPKAENSF